ncbi:STM3941 family protein [Rothia sp. ARF10]|nr:STM3941 family protein [Rothia sp. ARF10]
MPAVAVERSRGKGVLALLGCAGFVLVCLLLASTGDPLALAIAALGIVTFGTFGLLWARQLLRAGPGLVVDEEGFDDSSSATAVGRVPWADVTNVTTWGLPGSTNVVVHVRNPDDHIARLGWFSRRAARANVRLLGTPVVLAAGGLRIDTDGLLSLLRDGFGRHSGSLGVVPPTR